MLGRPLRIDWHPADTPEALKAVYQAEGDSGLRTRLPVVACQAEAEALPFAAGSCDRVMANHMLYHVPHQEQALRELRHGKPPHQLPPRPPRRQRQPKDAIHRAIHLGTS